MDEIICTVEIGRNNLDNDFIFYADGRIKNEYDRSAWKLNQERWLKPSEISNDERTKILEKCASQFKDQIESILSSND